MEEEWMKKGLDGTRSERRDEREKEKGKYGQKSE